MNSPFATIFEAIMKRIVDNVPEIKYISQDFGQLEDYSNGTRPKVAFPCALIDFQNWNFENLGDSSQRAEGDVLIKLAFARFADTNNVTEKEWREIALQDYEVEWKLNNALHGWTPGCEFGYLTRTQLTTENRPLAVRLRPLRYRLAFEDYSTKPVREKTPRPTLVVTTQDADIPE